MLFLKLFYIFCQIFREIGELVFYRRFSLFLNRIYSTPYEPKNRPSWLCFLYFCQWHNRVDFLLVDYENVFTFSSLFGRFYLFLAASIIKDGSSVVWVTHRVANLLYTFSWVTLLFFTLGVNIYAIGIGNNIDFDQLNKITRNPHRVFHAESFYYLENGDFVNSVSDVICDNVVGRCQALS